MKIGGLLVALECAVLSSVLLGLGCHSALAYISGSKHELVRAAIAFGLGALLGFGVLICMIVFLVENLRGR